MHCRWIDRSSHVCACAPACMRTHPRMEMKGPSGAEAGSTMTGREYPGPEETSARARSASRRERLCTCSFIPVVIKRSEVSGQSEEGGGGTTRGEERDTRRDETHRALPDVAGGVELVEEPAHLVALRLRQLGLRLAELLHLPARPRS